MERITELHIDFIKRINNTLEVMGVLEKEGITILNGFLQNIDQVRSYYQEYYSTKSKRIVLCGINPGKNGAGKTGVPFIDFKSLTHLLPGINQYDSENSAQFVWSIINQIGTELFFEKVYLTNISWFGFIKDGKNFNYYNLPSHLSDTFTESFLKEMDLVQPKVIIPLSKEVEQTLIGMKKRGKLNYSIASRLPHPYYCSIGDRALKYKDIYVEKIQSYIEELNVHGIR